MEEVHKEKALELYNTFQQYTWDDELGWMPDSKETKNVVVKVIDEIKKVVPNNPYWKLVRKAVMQLD